MIDHDAIQCFNERRAGMCKSVVRPFREKLPFGDKLLKSGYGKDVVVVIPFTCEVRVKSISLVAGDDGEAPSELKLYKNE